MVRQLMKNRYGQNTAEYALLIALVIAAIIAMQAYAQKALQAKVRDASIYMTKATNAMGNTYSYEPVATLSDETTSTEREENTRLGAGTDAHDTSSNRSRQGNQIQTYNTNETVGVGAVPKGL